MIRHVSLFVLKKDGDLSSVLGGIEAVRDLVPGMLGCTFGPDAGFREGNAHVASVFDFDDEAAYRAWDAHPDHQRVRRERILPHVESVQRAQIRVPDLPGAQPERVPGNVRRREATGEATLWKWFRADGRLERLPAAPADRRKVLERIAERFARGRDYEEREVNVLLAQVDDDFATLRRYLIDERILEREKGRYRLR